MSLAAKLKGSRAFRALDQFAYTPAPRLAQGQQVSLRGLLGTVVLWALFIVFLVTTLGKFFADEPAISIVDSPTSDELIAMPPLGLTFRRNVDGRPLNLTYDDRLFRVHFEEVVVYNQDEEVRDTTLLDTRECDLSAWAGWSGADARCPGREPKIGGRYQSSQYTFFAAHVSICDPGAPFQYPNGTAVVCAARSEIDRVLSDGRFNLLMNMHTFDHGGQFESIWYLYNSQQRQLFEGIYHKLHVTETPNFAWAWTTKTAHMLRLSMEKTLLRPQTLSPGLGGRLVLSIYARLDSYDVKETRGRTTILELLGQLGATYRALFAVLGLYFAAYNRAKFYRAFPHWDNLGERPFLLGPSSTAAAASGGGGGGGDAAGTTAPAGGDAKTLE